MGDDCWTLEYKRPILYIPHNMYSCGTRCNNNKVQIMPKSKNVKLETSEKDNSSCVLCMSQFWDRNKSRLNFWGNVESTFWTTTLHQATTTCH